MEAFEPPSAEVQELVEKACRRIEADPESLDMRVWVWVRKTEYAWGDCHTVACLAGHVVLAAGIPEHPWYTTRDHACRLLHLDLRRGGMTLFCDFLWPARWRNRFKRAKDPQEKAAIAVERFRHWAATGE